MIWIFAVLAGLLGAVAGWFVTGAIAVFLAGLGGMSDFEGGRGMFGFFAIGPIGGIAGMVVAVWATLRVGQGRASLGATFGRIGIVLAAIAALVAGGVGLRLATIDTYQNELPPELAFEVRMPAAMAPATPVDVDVELHTDENVGEGLVADHWIEPGTGDLGPDVASEADGGRRVVAGVVALAFKTRSRLLVVKVPGQLVRLFALDLGRDPASTSLPTTWQRARFLDDPGDAAPVAAPTDDPIELRYRVRRAGDD